MYCESRENLPVRKSKLGRRKASSALLPVLCLALAAICSCSSGADFVEEQDAEKTFIRGTTIRFEETEALTGRIGDFAGFLPAEKTTLTGVGIVVGLSGTGDHGEAFESARSLVESIPDLRAPPGTVFEPRSVAMVMVECHIDPSLGAAAGLAGASVRPLGNASSLEDGTLLWTDLVKPESGEVGAVAFGPVLTSTVDSKGERVFTPTLGRLLRIEVRDAGKAGFEKTLAAKIAWRELCDAMAQAIRKEFPAFSVETRDRESVLLKLPSDPTLYPEDWQARILDLSFTADSGGLPRILVDARSNAIKAVGQRVYLNRGTFLQGGQLKVVSFAPQGPPRPPSGKEHVGDATDGAMIEVTRDSVIRRIKTLRWLRHAIRVLDRLAVPIDEIRRWLESTSAGGGIGAEVIRAEGMLEREKK